jgi:hypothetical protein
VSEKFGCKSVDDKADGLNVESVMIVGIVVTRGMITDDKETF